MTISSDDVVLSVGVGVVVGPQEIAMSQCRRVAVSEGLNVAVSQWLSVSVSKMSQESTQEKKEEGKGEFVNWHYKTKTETLYTKGRGVIKIFLEEESSNGGRGGR